MRTVIRNSTRRENSLNPFAKPELGNISLQESSFEEAVVVDVILDETHPDYSEDGYNVGAIKFRFLVSDFYKASANLNYAFPLESNIQEYPLLNETVVVILLFNRFFYTRKLNLINRVTAQSLFNINLSLDDSNISSVNSSGDYYKSQGTPKKIQGNTQETSYGKYFKDNPNIFRLKSFEGDLVIQGRFGNSIRFGSASKTNASPNILLRAGQSPSANPNVKTPFGLVVEDINDDSTSLWLVANQIVTLKLSTEGSAAHNKSISDASSQFDGNQIILNSGRIIINSKQDKIYLNSNNGVHLTSTTDVTVDASQNFKSYIQKDYELQVQNNLNTTVKNNIIIIGKKIHIGSSEESQPMVLGEELRSLLFDLVNAHLTSAGNYVMTGMGPGVLTPSLITSLTQILGKLQPRTTPILSQDNFVAHTNG